MNVIFMGTPDFSVPVLELSLIHIWLFFAVVFVH